MLFNSLEYFIFLPIVLALYYALSHRLQNRMLLAASYVFYGAWDYRFLGLILLSTTVDYFAGRALYRATTARRRRLFLIVSIAVNLGILGFFKYCDFFIETFGRLVAAVGLEATLPVLYVILPLGVSFYTFQEITYILAIYRGQMKPVNNFLDYALFVCYFPQLVAGPIERAQNLIPKLQAKRLVTAEHFVSGCLLILIGLFRKVVIADGLAPQINLVFAHPQSYSTPELVAGLYGFALQIYCDFAGYTDIARGTSRLLGIDLMENFNQPYFSTNISEFWRRWHISLSTWLRDYLYIPLGGNRGGKLATYRNMMLTMLLGGLWHGASWSFVAWGGLHGLYMTVHRFLTERQRNRPSEIHPVWNWRALLGILVTFHLVAFAWVFFRAPGFSAAVEYLRQVLAFRGLETWSSVLPAILIPWLLTCLIDIPQYLAHDQVTLLRWHPVARNATVAVMLFIILLAFGTHAPFIYFQF